MIGSAQKTYLETDLSKTCELICAGQNENRTAPHHATIQCCYKAGGEEETSAKFHSHIYHTDFTHFTTQLLQNSAGDSLAPAAWRFSI